LCLRQVLPAFVWLACTTAFGQAEFRRGDANEDGVVDIGDVGAILTYFLSFNPFPPPCWDALDINDDGTVNLADATKVISYLFLGTAPPPAPGPDTPGPDPTEDGVSCEVYDPVPRQPRNDFRLDFECPIEFSGARGEAPKAEVFGTLAVRGEVPALGWSLSVGVEGSQVRIVEATVEGTVAAPWPDGLFSDGFERTEVVDPSRGEQGPGVVSAVILSLSHFVLLKPVSLERIVKITIDASGDGVPAGRVFYVDGKRGSGQPVGNVIATFNEDATAATPELGSCGDFRLSEPAGLQLPGDCNQDGLLDIADAICIFGVHFSGTPPAFPCGDGTSGDAANLELLDWQADRQIDLSDGVSALNWLFLDGPPHQLGRSCVRITWCDEDVCAE
jgi:hypothetical protein